MPAPKQKKLQPCDGPDTVCHHSGLPRETCDYLCTSCTASFRPCPDRDEIYRRAELLRNKWPSWRIDQVEGRSWEMEVPEAIRVWVYARQ